MTRRQDWSGLFWTAFRQSRNAMVLLDEQRRYVEVNGAYLKLLGYSRRELVGRPFHEFVVGGPILSPEEWQEPIADGDFAGVIPLVAAGGDTVAVQFAVHPEVVTGRRLVLGVAIG